MVLKESKLHYLIKEKHDLFRDYDNKKINLNYFNKRKEEIQKEIDYENKQKINQAAKDTKKDNFQENKTVSKPIKEKTPRDFSVRNYIIESLKDKKIKDENKTVKQVIKNKYGPDKLKDESLIKKTKNQIRNFISCVKKQAQSKVKDYEWDGENYMLKNKKAQLNNPNSFTLINPIFILGVILFCIPIIINLYGDVASWLSYLLKGVGLLFIIVGFLVIMLNRGEAINNGY